MTRRVAVLGAIVAMALSQAAAAAPAATPVPSATPATPSAADEAHSLNKFLAQNGYGWTSIDLSERNAEFISVALNGSEFRMRVDTGAYHTAISWSTAHDLKLKVKNVKGSIVGVGGVLEGDTGLAMLSSFRIGPYEINRVNPIVVLPGPARLGNYNCGYFGLDYLAMNQVILPVAQRIFFFKPGPRSRVDIQKFMLDLGFHAVPLALVPHVGVVISGDVDGHPMRAIVDCGCQFSTFDYGFARDIAQAPLEPLPGGFVGVDGRVLASYAFTPKSMHLGPYALPEEMFSASKGVATLRDGTNALLGYDVLGPHHAILDFGSGVMWLK